MSAPDIPNQPSLFTRTLDECRELYVSSGKLCAHEYPHLIAKKGDDFIQLMDDLHRALVLKVYFSVCEADRKWSRGRAVSWPRCCSSTCGASGSPATSCATRPARRPEDVSKLKWYSLIRPFDRIVPLRDRIGDAGNDRDAAGEHRRPGRRRAAASTKPASSSRFKRSCITICGRSRSTSRRSTRSRTPRAARRSRS